MTLKEQVTALFLCVFVFLWVVFGSVKSVYKNLNARLHSGL